MTRELPTSIRAEPSAVLMKSRRIVTGRRKSLGRGGRKGDPESAQRELSKGREEQQNK